MEQNKIVYIYFANGVESAADETSLISREVECMGLTFTNVHVCLKFTYPSKNSTGNQWWGRNFCQWAIFSLFWWLWNFQWAISELSTQTLKGNFSNEWDYHWGIKIKISLLWSMLTFHDKSKLCVHCILLRDSSIQVTQVSAKTCTY